MSDSTDSKQPPAAHRLLVSRPHWSYSQISQYLRCPLQYYFERVLKLPRPTVPGGMALGSAIHAGLADFHRHLQRGEDFSKEQLQQSFLAAFGADEGRPLELKENETRQSLSEDVNWSQEPAYRVYQEYMRAAEDGREISPQLRQEFMRAKRELLESVKKDLIDPENDSDSRYIGNSTTLKDPIALILGDWGRWNFLRFFVLFFLLWLFCFPLFGGHSLIAWGNIFCFPFWLNDRLTKFDDWLDKK